MRSGSWKRHTQKRSWQARPSHSGLSPGLYGALSDRIRGLWYWMPLVRGV